MGWLKPGRVDKPDPDADSAQQDGAEKAGGGLVVASSDDDDFFHCAVPPTQLGTGCCRPPPYYGSRPILPREPAWQSRLARAGDAINIILAALGYNFRLLLAWLAVSLRWLGCVCCMPD